jgi:hypothetical protein
MKQLLIMTGPQGSGNHLWSKILGETPEVEGWTELTKKYWVGHGNEPFALIWEDPSLFDKIDFPHSHYVTSISCPYMPIGGPRITKEHPAIVPDYDAFITYAKLQGFEVKLLVIGREKNIVEYQQQRIRSTHTVPMFLKELDDLMKYDPVFASTELLYLYKQNYLKQLSKLLDFPISVTEEKLEEILKDNSNAKYLKYVDHAPLDDHLIAIAAENGDPNNPNVYRPKQ